jgi:hypothetical protein
MNSYEPQKHQNSPKKRKSPHTSTFSPPDPKAQLNRHLHHPQITLPRPQKVPRLKRTQNDEKRTKNRVFSVSSISPPPDHQKSSNLRRNRLETDPHHSQKVSHVKRKQRDEKRTQTLPFSPFSTFSVSPPPDNETRQNLHRNRRRSDPRYPQKVPQVKRKENNRKIPPKRRQLTHHWHTTSTMDQLTHIRNLVLKVKSINEEQIKSCGELAKTLAEMRADLKAKGTMANSSSSNIILPVPHTPSIPSPTIPQPSYISISSQTTPPVVHQPSYTSVSIQTEPLTEIFEIATPTFTNTPIAQSPPTPTLSLDPMPLPPLLPTSPLIRVSAPISESLSGSSILPRLQARSNRLATFKLRPQPYPTSQLRPEPEPPPGHGPTNRVRRGRRTLKRG